jgi:general secretion pathway protein K
MGIRIKKYGYSLFAAHENGIALVSVLWIVALLSIVAAGMSANVRTESRMVANTIASTRALYIAEGSVDLAVLNLSVPQSLRWPTDGSVQELEIENAAVRIAVFDEAGKIDLNFASAELLGGLLASAEVEAGQATLLVDAIMDWRDTDDFRRLNGAEESDYYAAGLDYGPKDRKFESVDELRLVIGMNRGIFSKIAPALTVYSHQSGVNAEVASPQVKQILSALGNTERTRKGSVYTIHVESVVDQTIISQVAAIVSVTQGIGRTPYQVLGWQQPTRRLFPASADSSAYDAVRPDRWTSE